MHMAAGPQEQVICVRRGSARCRPVRGLCRFAARDVPLTENRHNDKMVAGGLGQLR